MLKSPDIPSVLLELGFLSSQRDLARLQDADWRAKMAGALRDGVLAWAEPRMRRKGSLRHPDDLGFGQSGAYHRFFPIVF